MNTAHTAHTAHTEQRTPSSTGGVLREIEDQPYGSREFAIADPEGNTWSFGTCPGEPRPVTG